MERERTFIAMGRTRTILLIAFFFSGFSALVYEIVWARILTLIFGASVYGQSIVLGLFMGGLAIGSKVFGEKAQKAFRPLAWYGKLEGIIGLFAIGSLFMPLLCDRFSFQLPFADLLIRLFICALFILPATIAMGGTFPILFKALKKYPCRSMENISKLYTVNTLGAVLGIALSSYVLLSRFGLTKTLLFAVAINLFLFFAFTLKKYPGFEFGDEKHKREEAPDKQVNYRFILTLSFSGFATFLYEIAWSRALNFSFGSSTYSFSLILLCFLSGLTLGAFWIRKKASLPLDGKRKLLCDLQTIICIVAAIFTFLASRMPLVTEILFNWSEGIYWKVHLSEVFVLFIIMTPAAFFIGASFPLMCSLASRDGEPNERIVGVAYCSNTLGAVIGALVTGFFLISALGPFAIIWVAIALHFFNILLAAPKPTVPSIRGNLFLIGVVGVFLILQFAFFIPNDLMPGYYALVYNKDESYLPRYLRGNPEFLARLEETAKLKEEPYKVIWFKHGLFSSIAVSRSNLNTRLIIDGKVDASAGNFFLSDMPTQSFLAFLPLVFSPKLDRGLVVGYGSGMTAGILSQYVHQTDCLEIEKCVIEASTFFQDYNFEVQKAENVDIILGDARKYIRRCSKRYDFISAEPSNIWVGGVAHLFTREYFDDCSRLLNDGGVMVQWLHLYKISLNDFKVAVRTFGSVFPTMEIWGSGNYGDVFLVGWKNKKKALSKEKFNSIVKTYPYKNEMKEIGAFTFEDFQRFRIIPEGNILGKLGKGDLHTDDRPVLEFSAGKNMFLLKTKEIFEFLER